MEEVLTGKNEMLFLATSVHAIVEHLTGQRDITSESIENFGANISRRAQYCKEREISFKHVIFPDKSNCLRHLFPIPEIRTFNERYSHLFDRNIIDLAAAISDWEPLVLRTDTHLNFKGKVETTLSIMNELDPSLSGDARARLESLKGNEFELLGDLGSKLSPQQTEIHHRINAPHARLFSNQVGANDGLTIVCFNKDLLKSGQNRRLLIFGDSFMERSLRLFSLFYSEILFCRTRYFHDEIAYMYKPDHLITESAERYFSNVRLDVVAPRFDLIYGLREHKYSTDQSFYAAFNAVLNFGTDQHKIFVSRLLSQG